LKFDLKSLKIQWLTFKKDQIYTMQNKYFDNVKVPEQKCERKMSII